MRLYLVRHGDALAGAPDSTRPLSQKGVSDMKKMAAFLKEANLGASVIFHSGLEHGQETAEILAASLAGSKVIKKDLLGPGDPVLPIFEEIQKRKEDLIIAGHMPHLSHLLSQILTGSPDSDLIDFKKGGVAALESDDSGLWRLRWYMIPKLL